MIKYILLIYLFVFIACSRDNNDSVESVNVVDMSLDSNNTFDEKMAYNLYFKCISCHGIKGDKVAPGSAKKVLISKLSKEEIIDSLVKYRAKTLSKGGNYAIMYLQTSKLSDNDIKLLANYITSFDN